MSVSSRAFGPVMNVVAPIHASGRFVIALPGRESLESILLPFKTDFSQYPWTCDQRGSAVEVSDPDARVADSTFSLDLDGRFFHAMQPEPPPVRPDQDYVYAGVGWMYADRPVRISGRKYCWKKYENLGTSFETSSEYDVYLLRGWNLVLLRHAFDYNIKEEYSRMRLENAEVNTTTWRSWSPTTNPGVLSAGEAPPPSILSRFNWRWPF